MKTLKQVIRRVEENPSRSWALTNLAKTERSTHRKAGPRLLVDSDCATLVVLSGGCLEEEIGRRGQKAIYDDLPVCCRLTSGLSTGAMIN